MCIFRLTIEKQSPGYLGSIGNWESSIVNCAKKERSMTTKLQGLKHCFRMPWTMPGLIAAAVLTLAMGRMTNSTFAGWNPAGGTGPRESSVAAGRWEGNVEIPGSGLRLVVDLAQNSEGNWIGSAVVPGLKVKGVALTDIAVNGADVAFAIKGVLGDPKLKGHIGAKGIFAGDYQEAGNSAPFALEKSGPPQVEPQVKSTPVRKELEGVWEGELALPGRALHVRVTLTNQAGGSATAKFHLKGKNDYDIPVDLVTDEDDLLTFESPAAHFIYQGWFHKGSKEIKGELQLGPYDEPVVLNSAATNAAEQK
jgi:hypothetical protein